MAEIPRPLLQRLESLRRAGLRHLPRTHGACRAAIPIELPAPARMQEANPAPEVIPSDHPPENKEPLMTGGSEPSTLLAQLAKEVAACTACAELASTRTQTVFGDGNPQARLVFMGEAPGADEDRQGVPFVGRAGKLLTDIITKGMRLRREDVYILNTLKCRPPGNRNPLPDEAAACRPFLDRQLELIRPEFICCLGAVAAQNLLKTSTPIGQLRGKLHDYHGIQVVCTYHPAYLLRNPAAKKQTWEDIQFLMRQMGMDVDQS